MLSRRSALGGMACLACAGLFAAPRAHANTPVPHTTLTPDQAIERLLDGNRRFVADDPSPVAAGRSRRASLTAGQAPFATIICCADSRAAPETLVHAGLGEIFVSRVAGNTIPPADLATVAYGVEALGTPAIMVLGHEACKLHFVLQTQRAHLLVESLKNRGFFSSYVFAAHRQA